MPEFRFPTTRVSLVLAAGGPSTEQSRDALATLCRIYWYPIYACVRRQGYTSAEAEDLVQGFFTRVLEKQYLRAFRRERGRFRSFLIGSLRHFLANQRDWQRAEKRGGGAVPVALDAVMVSAESRYSLEPRHEMTPEKLFERQWALTVLSRVEGRLEEEFARSGKSERFERLKRFLTGEASDAGYRQLADDWATTEGAVKVAIHRLRQRFREILREEISQTVADPGQIGAEVQYLMSVIRT